MENEIKSEKQDSISVSRTTKGAYSWDIKKYFDGCITKGDDVIAELKRLDGIMQQQFKGGE